jgi:hypothetical protein
MGNESKSISVEKHEGGYVVYTPDGSMVTTSLQKVIQAVKAAFAEPEVAVKE